MKKIAAVVGVCFVTFSGFADAQLGALSNEDMDEVVGQQGVAISLDWRLNVAADGSKLGLCTGATYKECRIAWAFNNRGQDDGTADTATTKGTGKKWLVLKGFTGELVIPYLRVEASSVTYTNDSNASESVPAVLLGLGDASGNGANTKVLIKNLTIDNMAMEQDNGTTRGYFTDALCEPNATYGAGTGGCSGASGGTNIPAQVNAGFMGFQIHGGNAVAGVNNPAQVQIDGTIKLFSCLGTHPSC